MTSDTPLYVGEGVRGGGIEAAGPDLGVRHHGVDAVGVIV
jgi:hypothetical protein